MKLNCYALYDAKAEAYLQPFFMRSHGEALRGLTDLVNDETTQVSKYSADYTLFHLGEYNDETGTLCPLDAKIPLGSAHDFKKTQRVASAGAPQGAPEILDMIPNARQGKES